MNVADWIIVDTLAQVAAEAPHALRLAVQLLGVAPCDGCDFIKEHCRCTGDTHGK